jgi:CPA1 family monovalent cation:H+ antiporter
MLIFEWTLILLVCAVALTGIARSIGAPYPSLLALGGAALALVPNAPVFTLDPELTLALFLAPVLLDAAFDTSVRDLKRVSLGAWRSSRLVVRYERRRDACRRVCPSSKVS